MQERKDKNNKTNPEPFDRAQDSSREVPRSPERSEGSEARGAKSRDETQTPNPENITISKQEYETLKSKSCERDSFYERCLRTQAEFENARKRLEKERIDFLKTANERLILEFLPILDNLEIAEKHIEEAKDFKAVQEGVDMIQTQIQKFLKDIGVERIKSVDEKFDPQLHEAVEIEESEDKDDGLIVAELKPGYKFNGRLLRPASVKIVKHKD